MKKLLLILLLPPFMWGMEVPDHALITKDPVKLLHDKTHYYVSDENASYRVANHEVSPMLVQVLKRNALAEYSRSCKIRVKKHKDGTYSLIDKVPGKGGGPLLGCAVLLGTQVAGFCGLIGGAMAANAVLPGGGTAVVGIALGTGGISGAVAAIQMTSITWSAWALALPTP